MTTMKTNRSEDKSIESTYDLSSQRFYHGTKANLKQGDLIEPGFNSNYGKRKYPGNPTKSYRSRNPLRVSGEITDWQGHSPEQLKAMKEHLERLKQLGIEAIED